MKVQLFGRHKVSQPESCPYGRTEKRIQALERHESAAKTKKLKKLNFG